ncbi:MAG: ATP-dependent 6-phosphofructokinase [Actinobacteria bacterium]|uniref:6-phosphofructokinase n=1 Tax=freshwater metagenome TaxID=449393 RepID=A0A6J7EGP6_9ZZZZ|nr:ATP-dependent 6-phosphofructokinase [Actinomycetota bacterium]
MKTAILTGGGDCPGLNAVIRAVVRRVLAEGHEAIGYRRGWAGVLEGDSVELGRKDIAGLLPRGGTILLSSRTNPYADGADGTQVVRKQLEADGVDALVVIGGEDTLGVAARLAADGLGVVGVPKTIDNDLPGTDRTFGFDTAVQIATDAIDRLHTTAESHDRIIIVEVMGRHAGWIACAAGLAGGADLILVPERPFEIDTVCAHLRSRHETGRSFSIVVTSEGATPAGGGLVTQTGATDAFGHARLGGIGFWLEGEIAQRTGYDARAVILGHVQRGGTPTATDRILATRLGLQAADAVLSGHFGVMAALHGTEVTTVPLARALETPRLLDPDLYADAEVFFG